MFRFLVLFFLILGAATFTYKAHARFTGAHAEHHEFVAHLDTHEVKMRPCALIPGSLADPYRPLVGVIEYPDTHATTSHRYLSLPPVITPVYYIIRIQAERGEL